MQLVAFEQVKHVVKQVKQLPVDVNVPLGQVDKQVLLYNNYGELQLLHLEADSIQFRQVVEH